MRIEASRSETEGWRVDRLKKALAIFCQVYGITDEQANLLVEGISDYRGLLTVRWISCSTTEEQERAWSIAWGLAGEDPACVKHHVAPI